ARRSTARWSERRRQSSATWSEGARGRGSLVQVLVPKPGHRGLEAGGIVHTGAPSQQLAGLAIAEALVLTQHLYRLAREQRWGGQARRGAQEPVAVLQREPDSVSDGVGQAPPGIGTAKSSGQTAGELLPGDIE